MTFRPQNIPQTRRFPDGFEKLSEQSRDFAVFVNVNALGSGAFGKTRHGENVACQHDNKTRSCRNLHVFDRYFEMLGRSEFRRIIGKAVLSLGNAHRAA